MNLRRLAGAGVLCSVLTATLLPPLALGNGEPEEDPEDAQEQALFRGMPDDDGRLEVFGFCGSCHSIDLVLQQGLSRAVWDEVLVEMVEDQEMVSLMAETRKKVLDYLEKYYGPDRRARKESEEQD